MVVEEDMIGRDAKEEEKEEAEMWNEIGDMNREYLPVWVINFT